MVSPGGLLVFVLGFCVALTLICMCLWFIIVFVALLCLHLLRFLLCFYNLIWVLFGSELLALFSWLALIVGVYVWWFYCDLWCLTWFWLTCCALEIWFCFIVIGLIPFVFVWVCFVICLWFYWFACCVFLVLDWWFLFDLLWIVCVWVILVLGVVVLFCLLRWLLLFCWLLWFNAGLFVALLFCAWIVVYWC